MSAILCQPGLTATFPAYAECIGIVKNANPSANFAAHEFVCSGNAMNALSC